jgi:hypothetical protein
MAVASGAPSVGIKVENKCLKFEQTQLVHWYRRYYTLKLYVWYCSINPLSRMMQIFGEVFCIFHRRTNFGR